MATDIKFSVHQMDDRIVMFSVSLDRGDVRGRHTLKLDDLTPETLVAGIKMAVTAFEESGSRQRPS